MEQVRAYLQEHFAGRKKCPSFFVTTLGCQMNARDSEKLEGMLEVMGFEKAAEESCADLVLYNTCTVRENANLKVYGRLGVREETEGEKSSYGDRAVRLYDAGGGRGGKTSAKISVY